MKNIIFVAMTDFGPDLGEILTAYPSEDLIDTLPMALKDYRQLYIAEAEKYAHMTFFLNGGYSHPVAGEKRLLVESQDVREYDLMPEMSAGEITENVIEAVETDKYDFIALNYANPDMVGHTGNLKAAVKAVSFIDKCIGRLIRALNKKNGTLIICADHGNVEIMKNDGNKEMDTQHNVSPTPFIIMTHKKIKKNLKPRGSLSSVAPTLLEAINVKVPKNMTGGSLWQ